MNSVTLRLFDQERVVIREEVPARSIETSYTLNVLRVSIFDDLRSDVTKFTKLTKAVESAKKNETKAKIASIFLTAAAVATVALLVIAAIALSLEGILLTVGLGFAAYLVIDVLNDIKRGIVSNLLSAHLPATKGILGVFKDLYLPLQVAFTQVAVLEKEMADKKAKLEKAFETAIEENKNLFPGKLRILQNELEEKEVAIRTWASSIRSAAPFQSVSDEEMVSSTDQQLQNGKKLVAVQKAIKACIAEVVKMSEYLSKVSNSEKSETCNPVSTANI